MRRSNMTTVTIQITAEQLASFKALGLSFNEVSAPVITGDDAPEGYIRVNRDYQPLGKIVESYLLSNDELHRGTIQRRSAYGNYNTTNSKQKFELHSKDGETIISRVYRDNEYYLLCSNDLLFVCSYRNSSYILKEYFIPNGDTLEKLIGLSGMSDYFLLVQEAIAWWVAEHGDDEVYRLKSTVLTENEELRRQIKEVQKENDDIRWYVDRYKSMEKARDEAIKQKDSTLARMHRMVNKNSYSGWHALYAFDYTLDMVDWYVDSRQEKAHNATPRVKLKEFNDALDEATFYLSRGNVIDPELKVKFQEVKLRCQQLESQLKKLNINIKYAEGNPVVAVSRILTILKAVL